jgi:hypothetical protein
VNAGAVPNDGVDGCARRQRRLQHGERSEALSWSYRARSGMRPMRFSLVASYASVAISSCQRHDSWASQVSAHDEQYGWRSATDMVGRAGRVTLGGSARLDVRIGAGLHADELESSLTISGSGNDRLSRRCGFKQAMQTALLRTQREMQLVHNNTVYPCPRSRPKLLGLVAVRCPR